ncbi:MAG TPA: (2Fe-2S) ferredoxin domain-containing protein, partial [Urbifossiella sp.]|nr:(2Fe-2S) ferredoxin domain-containing protein [Urbifossiella sp.]
MTPAERAELAAIADKLLIGHFHRHVFLCLGPTCCGSEAGEAAWKALKRELKDRSLSLATGPAACYRTKVGCLRV